MVHLRRRARREKQTDDLSGHLVTLGRPDSAASEAYRTLRTSLLYARVDMPPKMIVITSHGAREGKSTICANLGVVLAQAGKKTLIVDCDLRNPVLHKMFELRNLRGVTDILLGHHDLDEVWQEPLPGLKLITAGPLTSHPAELVTSQRFAEFLNRLRQGFDYVLIDSPPVGSVSDSLTLATQGDGVLLVLDAQKTRKVNVRQAMRSLRTVRANVLGTVMNNVKGVRGGYDGYANR